MKNTKWIYGVAVYTGHQTKVMMNSSKNVAKFSKIEKWTNRYIMMGILIQICVCLLASVLESFY